MPTVVIIQHPRPPIHPNPVSLLKAKQPQQPQAPYQDLRQKSPDEMHVGRASVSRSLEELRLGAECAKLKAALIQQAEVITRLEEENRALTKAVHRLA